MKKTIKVILIVSFVFLFSCENKVENYNLYFRIFKEDINNFQSIDILKRDTFLYLKVLNGGELNNLYVQELDAHEQQDFDRILKLLYEANVPDSIENYAYYGRYIFSYSFDLQNCKKCQMSIYADTLSPDLKEIYDFFDYKVGNLNDFKKIENQKIIDSIVFYNIYDQLNKQKLVFKNPIKRREFFLRLRIGLHLMALEHKTEDVSSFPYKVEVGKVLPPSSESDWKNLPVSELRLNSKNEVALKYRDSTYYFVSKFKILPDKWEDFFESF